MVLHTDWMQTEEASARQLNLKVADVLKIIIPSLDQSQVERSCWVVKGQWVTQGPNWLILIPGPHKWVTSIRLQF